MILLTIGKKKGEFFEVFANYKFLGFFSKEILLRLKIKNNTQYSIEEIKKIKLAGNIDYAKKKALLILKNRDHSSNELFLKLTKYVKAPIASYVVSKMKKLGLINDINYAENLAQKLIFVKNKSKKFAILEMKRKGIEPSLAEKIVNSFKVDAPTQIERLILKKYKEKLKNSKQKVVSSLLNQGFSYYDIDFTIKKLNLS